MLIILLSIKFRVRVQTNQGNRNVFFDIFILNVLRILHYLNTNLNMLNVIVMFDFFFFFGKLDYDSTR